MTLHFIIPHHIDRLLFGFQIVLELGVYRNVIVMRIAIELPGFALDNACQDGKALLANKVLYLTFTHLRLRMVCINLITL